MYILVVSLRYSIAEARAQLPTIIGQAASGAHVKLTRRGEPVAVLVSTVEFERLRGRKQRFGAAYQRFLDRYELAEIGVGPRFAPSLRDRAPGRDAAL